MPDARKNFAFSTVATAPSPATSGLSLVVATGEGANFPDPSTEGAFNVVICPVGTQPTSSNAEIARCTARSTDTFTIVRAQEGTSARTVVIGDQIFLSLTKKPVTDAQRFQMTIDAWKRATYENYSRLFLTNTDIVIGATGVLYLIMGPWLEKGEVISQAEFAVNAAAVTPTHSWFCLVDPSSRAVLSKGNDDTTTAWSTTAAGVVPRVLTMSPYTMLSSMAPYIGLVITAGTMPTLRGISTWAPPAKNNTPKLVATSTTGLTDPTSLGGTAAALVNDFGAGVPWVGLS